MSGTSQQGFQVLLDAERDAAALVNEARQYRTQRLKDARTEASLEIEALKRQKNEELAENDRKYVGELEQTVEEFAQITETRLQETGMQIEKNRSAVIKLLMDGVTHCEPRLHPNAELKLRQQRGLK